MPSLYESKSVLPSEIRKTGKRKKSVLIFRAASPKILPAAARHAGTGGESQSASGPCEQAVVGPRWVSSQVWSILGAIKTSLDVQNSPGLSQEHPGLQVPAPYVSKSIQKTECLLIFLLLGMEAIATRTKESSIHLPTHPSIHTHPPICSHLPTHPSAPPPI